MKLTLQVLKKIIKEELQNLNENSPADKFVNYYLKGKSRFDLDADPSYKFQLIDQEQKLQLEKEKEKIRTNLIYKTRNDSINLKNEFIISPILADENAVLVYDLNSGDSYEYSFTIKIGFLSLSPLIHQFYPTDNKVRLTAAGYYNNNIISIPKNYIDLLYGGLNKNFGNEIIISLPVGKLILKPKNKKNIFKNIKI